MKRKSIVVKIGNIFIGGENPVIIQSMAEKRTEKKEEVLKEIKELIEAGSEMVRIAVNTEEAAKAVPFIIEELKDKGYNIPIIGDFHFNGAYLLKKFPQTAKILDKYRINPGTTVHQKDFDEMIKIAIENDKPVRIGGNLGSVDKKILDEKIKENKDFKKSLREISLEALIESVIRSAERAIEIGLAENKIILSAKTSDVKDLIYVYRELAKRTRFPLHIGLTEAGGDIKGIVSSSIGIGTLLLEGIGDTIRVSLTERKDESRRKEVEVAKEILQALNLRRFHPEIISCPGCGRTDSEIFKEIAEKIDNYLKTKRKEWEKIYPHFKELKIAIMGCVVNGPGEAKFADLALCLPGKGEKKATIYKDGNFLKNVKIENAEEEFKVEIENYLKGRTK
ncbi:MAG: flavodoxin-dependent (E)-4-hydroxy-3-methylbut-2-enyl-diphosphate synthase [candidate division WOR-3 bacterium]